MSVVGSMSMPALSDRPRLAVVLSGWPRVSETFALNDLLGLHRADMLAAVFATKPGDQTLSQPGSDELDAMVEVLPNASVDEQAVIVAEQLAGLAVAGVHGYFAHRPAAVAEAAAARLGVPFGFSAHALDVRKVDRSELRRRIEAATVVVGCNADVAATLVAAGARPRIIGHGVDLEAFTITDNEPATAVSLLAVGRLVEKKGFDVLVEAARAITVPFVLDIVGDGPERPHLEAATRAFGLHEHIRFCGRTTHADLPAMYARCDIVVVPSRIDRRDDRDGLPNVVLEAMASGRPVVASDVASIATAVRDDGTGVLVPPDRPDLLAAAIDHLARDSELRRRLGRQARMEAEARFDLRCRGRELRATLERAYGR